jgi:uncharacterized protein involved in exopolysaccharide biosynthesis
MDPQPNPANLSNAPRPQTAVPAAPPPPPPGLNIGTLIRRILAHWPVSVAVAILGFAITFVVVKNRKLTYRSEVSIFYREGMKLEGQGDPLKQLGAKLKEMLLSQASLKIVIDKCHFKQDEVKKKGYVDIIEGMRKKIDFKARTQDTFAITFDAGSREEAQDCTQQLAQVLIDETDRRHDEQVKGATEFLDAEKKRLDEDLTNSEKAVTSFVAEHPEYALEASTRPGLQVRNQSKKESEAAKKDAASEKERMKADRIAQQQAGGTPAPVGVGPAPKKASPSAPPADIDPELLKARKDAQQQVASTTKEFEDLSQKYTPEYPDVQNAAHKKAMAEAALRDAEAKIAAATPPPPPPVNASPEDPYADGPGRPAPVAARPPDPEAEQKKAKEASKSSQQMVEVEATWQRLTRERDLAAQRVSDLETKRFKAEMNAETQLGGFSGQLAVLDPATRPNGPVSLPNGAAAMVGLIASIVAGVAGAGARGIILDDRIFDAGDIEGLELGPVLAVVPRTSRKRGLVKRAS